MNDAFDAEAILAALTPPRRGELASITIAEQTPSTQADALAAPVPEQGCALFLAEHQSAGQGRQGRSWVSAPARASLAMSLSRRFRAPVASMSGLSLVAGIAVAEALALEGVRLKWPNDLVVDGRKLGGILVNLRAGSGAVGAPTCNAVIGIGLNLRLPPDTAIDQPWTDLARCGAEPFTRNALVAALLEVILPALERFEHEGMSPFVARWQRLDALAGREVRVHEGERVHEGLLVGITASGALRLRSGGEESVFNSGEVSLRSA